MKFVSVVAASSIALALSCPSLALADAIYSHTGAQEDTHAIFSESNRQYLISPAWYPSLTPSGTPIAYNLTTTFTLKDKLGANLSNVDFAADILSWTSGTGVTQDAIASGMPGSSVYFAVGSTDAAGDLVLWNIAFKGTNPGVTSEKVVETNNTSRTFLTQTYTQDELHFDRVSTSLNLATFVAARTPARSPFWSVLVSGTDGGGTSPTGGTGTPPTPPVGGPATGVPEPRALGMALFAFATLAFARRSARSRD